MEEGHSSAVLALSDKGGIPLESTQAELTPLQRHVLTLTIEKQNEQIEEQRSSNQAGSGGAVNSLRKPQGGGRGQTTTYVNESLQ